MRWLLLMALLLGGCRITHKGSDEFVLFEPEKRVVVVIVARNEDTTMSPIVTLILANVDGVASAIEALKDEFTDEELGVIRARVAALHQKLDEGG